MARNDATLRIRRRCLALCDRPAAVQAVASRQQPSRAYARHYPRPPARSQAWRCTPHRAGAWLRWASHGFCLALVGLSIVVVAGFARPTDAGRSLSGSMHAAPTPAGTLDSRGAQPDPAQPSPAAAPIGQTVALNADDSWPERAAGADGRGAWGAAPLARQHRLAVELTAYSASEEEGTAAGLTFTGVRARPGTVAVDPAVIPLGSRLRIAGLAGIYRAEDTGGGIRNAHVDVFTESRALALEFGRRSNVLVEILDQ